MILLLLILLEVIPTLSQVNKFTVTSTANTVAGILSQAILDGNTTVNLAAGNDIIQFSVNTVTITSDLPSATQHNRTLHKR